MTPADSSAMLQVLNPREQAIVRLATWEGMRPGEILALRAGDVDIAGECIWVRHGVYKGKLGDPKTIVRNANLPSRSELWRFCRCGSNRLATGIRRLGYSHLKTERRFGATTFGPEI